MIRSEIFVKVTNPAAFSIQFRARGFQVGAVPSKIQGNRRIPKTIKFKEDEISSNPGVSKGERICVSKPRGNSPWHCEGGSKTLKSRCAQGTCNHVVM